MSAHEAVRSIDDVYRQRFGDRLGHCYELAGRKLVHDMHDELTVVLVHGTIQGAGHDPIGHAWIEYPNVSDGHGGVETWAWEPVTEALMPLGSFSVRFNCESDEPAVRYPAEAACVLMVDTGHFGPWTSEDEARNENDDA